MMQVLARSFDVMAILASTWPLGKRDAFIALAGLVDKMADMKLKGPAGDALTALSEACSPQFVCTQLHKKAAAHKNPKVRPGMLSYR
jgi:cytoskeleton-associated protein 5